MDDAKALTSKFHLIYDPAFDSLKMDVFCDWILEAVLELEQTNQSDRRTVLARFQERLGFDVRKSQRTRNLFDEALKLVVEKGWIDAEPIPAVGQVQIVYVSLPAGRERIAKANRARDELLGTCYGEFAVLMAYRFFPRHQGGADRDRVDVDDSVNLNRQEQAAAIKRMEALFHDVGSFKKGFFVFLDRFGQQIANKLIRRSFTVPVSQSSATSGDEKYTLRECFDPGSFIDPSSSKRFFNALEHVYKRLGELELHNLPCLQHWFYLQAYKQLFESIWPDEDIQSRLKRHLDCVYVYLDTNVLVAALAETDYLHQQATQILNFLFENQVKMFWLERTEDELFAHLELSRELIEVIGHRPEREIREILELTNPPSFVKTYFEYKFRNWKRFEKEIRKLYYQLRDKSLYQGIQLWSERDKEFARLRAEHESVVAQQLEKELQASGIRRHPGLIRHDTWMLASIMTLREQMAPEFAGPECKAALEEDKLALGELVWLASFDRQLHSFYTERAGGNQDSTKTKSPLTLIYETILLFFDPYAVSKALQETKKKPSIDAIDTFLPLRDTASLKRVIDKAHKEMKAVQFINEYIDHFNWQQIEHYKQGVKGVD